MKINILPDPKYSGVCYLDTDGYIYIQDDEEGYPIYEKQDPYIGFNPKNIVKYSQMINMNPFEYLYFAILHEIGHLIHGEHEQSIENEIEAWEYALSIDSNIPRIIIITTLCSYI